MAEAGKDTIYIDVDDEITSIIDKLRASKQKIVALVLPKRATVLQSVVNMKLLKRSADDLGKRVVLITSEASILPLAGAVGLYAAKTLQSKPLIPAAPEAMQLEEPVLDAEVPAEEPELDDSKSIGELAGLPAEQSKNTAVEDTIDIDNDAEDDKKSDSKKSKTKKNKKLKVPDFNKFRVRLFLAIMAVLLAIGFWVLASVVLPKASVTITTDTSTVTINPSFTADTSATTVDTANGIVPAQMKTVQKTDSEQVTATGQKDVGTKATGSVTLSIPCSSVTGNPPTIPAGSGVSTGGQTYITQKDDTLSNPDFSNGCAFTGDTTVVAQQNGEKYNVGAGQSFTVAGYSEVTGTNAAAISGGTSKVVTVVSQSDIDGAKQKMLDKNRDAVKSDLTKQFTDSDYQPVLESFSSGTPNITSTPNVGDQASTVTVNAAITYTMLGIKHDDLKQIEDFAAKQQLDITKQPIQDYGFNNVVFTVVNAKDPNKVKLTMTTDVATGVKLNADDIKKLVAGKKKGDIQQQIGQEPNVKTVDVKFSPFWVSKAPKNTGKITVTFQQASNAGGQ